MFGVCLEVSLGDGGETESVWRLGFVEETGVFEGLEDEIFFLHSLFQRQSIIISIR